jgi:hypothetical protein
MRRLRLVLILLVVLLVAALVVAPAGAKKKPKKHKPAPGFTPAVLAGNWNGTWTNTRFNTNGTLTLTVDATAATLGWTATIGGNTFGCAPPAPQSFTLTKGSGPNHWNAAGFSIAGGNAAFGDFAATYSFRGGTLTASGKNLSCAPGLSFTVSGHFTAKAFTATATITLPNGGGTATTNVSLTRS